MELTAVAEQAVLQSQSQGAEKTLAQAASTVAKEFSVEGNRFSLLRTTFDQNLSLKAITDSRMAGISANQFTKEAIASAAKEAVASAKGSPQDSGNGFAPNQGTKSFSFGHSPANEEWMYGLLHNLLQERDRHFPKVVIESGIVKFVKSEKVLATSDGCLLKADHGHYEGFVMFTAKDGKQSSSFNYSGFNLAADAGGQPLTLMQTAGLNELIRQSEGQTTVQRVPAKFAGDVIVTPHCLEALVGYWSSYLGSGRMLRGSSFFKDKTDQLVASPKWTLTSQPLDSNFASRRFWTSDGYLAQNESIFEKGLLKNYLLNHYAANKLGQKISRSEGTFLKVAPGDTPLQEMVGSVKKGILMCRYSAGNPSENGDISGVAKNSYYIENGEIKFPIGETMVAGNLQRMLHDIQAISRESINSGYWEFPWVRFAGVSVS